MRTVSHQSLVVCLAIAAFFLGVPRVSGQGLSAEFTNTITSGPGHATTTRGRFYRAADGKTREEVDGRVTIVDIARRTWTLLVPERLEAIVLSVPPNQVGSVAPRDWPGRSATPSADLHNGRAVKKLTLESVGDGPAHEIWTDEATGLVVRHKTSSASGVAVREMKILEVAEPDAELFMVPAGYSVSRGALPPRPVSNGSGRPPRF